MTNNPDPSAYEAELLRLAEAATPGEWKPTPGHPSGRFYGVHSAGGPIVRFHGIAKAATVGHHNAAYIAAACNAVPALLAENARLRECVRKDAEVLTEIVNECPATCETSPAHSMADLARARLADREDG